MSVGRQRIATHPCLLVALLAGLLPAQEKPVVELRKENAALRKEVKTLRAELDAKTSKALKEEQGVAIRAIVDRELKTRMLNQLRQAEVREFRNHGNQATDDRRVRVEYRGAASRLTQATEKLKRMQDPRKARVIVDEIDRALLDVRRALWKLEQAEKKKAKDPVDRYDLG